jgi:uncharacterized membrane protein YbhN (UPF0104 family)
MIVGLFASVFTNPIDVSGTTRLLIDVSAAAMLSCGFVFRQNLINSATELIVRLLGYSSRLRILKSHVHKIDRLSHAFVLIGRGGSGLSRSAILSIVFQFLYAVLFALAGYSVGLDIPLPYYLLASTVFQIAQVIPISLAGIGIKDLSYVALLTWLGADYNKAVSSAAVVYPITLAIAATGWWINQFHKHASKDDRSIR